MGWGLVDFNLIITGNAPTFSVFLFHTGCIFFMGFNTYFSTLNFKVK